MSGSSRAATGIYRVQSKFTTPLGFAEFLALSAPFILHIMMRSKNVLITSFGRNISPEWVESELLSQPEIAQAVVYGDGAPALSAFLVPGFKGADINRSLERGVSEPEKAYYNRALAHEGLDDPKSAYFDYQKALEIAPDWDAPRQQLSRFTVSRR